MVTYVTRLEAVGLYGLFDISQQFQPGVNVLYGQNGSGKTTLLHILANALRGDFERFVFLDFDELHVELSDGTTIHLDREPRQQPKKINHSSPLGEGSLDIEGTRERMDHNAREEYNSQSGQFWRGSGEEPSGSSVLDCAYYPAFRTMFEAWSRVTGEPAVSRWMPRSRRRGATPYVRELFGNFVPTVEYLSLRDIESELDREVGVARAKVSHEESRQLSSLFLRVFESLVESPTDTPGERTALLDEIQSLTEEIQAGPFGEGAGVGTDVYRELSNMVERASGGGGLPPMAGRVLEVYRDSLVALCCARTEAYEVLLRYLNSVNEFLEGKQLRVRKGAPGYPERAIRVAFSDADGLSGLRVLSSGEREIVTLIYAATHMSEQSVVLIDEPELSLHVDWQRRLVHSMEQQLGERQIIACTHSPVIGADFPDRLAEVRLTATARPRASTAPSGAAHLEDALP
jgi:predicted ATPase